MQKERSSNLYLGSKVKVENYTQARASDGISIFSNILDIQLAKDNEGH
jgi:3D (Asp-Asp-Asp) domain-containing protein